MTVYKLRAMCERAAYNGELPPRLVCDSRASSARCSNRHRLSYILFWQAFFVLFRETLEAAVLVAVILQFLDRKGHPEIKAEVWNGTILGAALSVTIGIILVRFRFTSPAALSVNRTTDEFVSVVPLPLW